jgi:DNA-binding NarL/FixJ family response regulator
MLSANDRSEFIDRTALAVHYAGQRLVEFTRSEDIAESGPSPGELQCLQRLAEGSRNDRIAENLGITPPAIKLHLQNARRAPFISV